DAKRLKDVRTVINGVAGADLQRVTVSLRGAPAQEVPHAPDGAFALVLRGYPEDTAPVVTIETATATHRYAFAGQDGATVADPYGLPAWRLITGSVQKGPNYRTCVSFGSARDLPGERHGVSPEVCGLVPVSSRIKRKPPFFTTQRVTAGKLPARVAVWG